MHPTNMERGHLIAGTRERITDRAHHPDDIPGYIGNRRRVRHGKPYPSSITGLTEYHGLTDGLTAPHHARALLWARKRLESGRQGHYQKLSLGYVRPPTGY